MGRDLISESGYLFLATRMKRLAERMQSDALKIFARNGFQHVTPAHIPILYGLDEEDGLTVSELVMRFGISQPAITRSVTGMQAEGLVVSEPAPEDQRQKVLSLSPKGRALVESLKRTAWVEITEAAENICDGLEGSMLDQLEQLETRLSAEPLTERGSGEPRLEVVDYRDELADKFYELNEAWISDMFIMEEADEIVMKNPRGYIIDKGGHILFIRAADGEIIGAGALQPVNDEGDWELTKMGVDARRRGEKAGELLLAALIQRARQIGVERLHLLTNKKCEAAIHLYEKLGFYHSDEVMQTFAAKYERANVAMRYPI